MVGKEKKTWVRNKQTAMSQWSRMLNQGIFGREKTDKLRQMDFHYIFQNKYVWGEYKRKIKMKHEQLFDWHWNIFEIIERKYGLVVKAQDWDLGQMNSIHFSATDLLHDFGQVT